MHQTPSTTSARVRLSAGRRYARISLAVLVLTGITLVMRLWQLDSVPPGLWWDEATQGLDAAELLSGRFRLFYPSALGKEPLYIYLTAPFAAAWYGEPFAVRLAGALLSVLMIPVLYAAGRALFADHPFAGTCAGVAAAILWSTNFWAQSISRIGFQVNAFPLVITVAVITWLNYVRRPDRRRAVTFGIVAGLTLYTYLAARITPVLWLLLFLLLAPARRRALRSTAGFAVLAFGLVALPLAVYFVSNPQDFLGRISTFAAVQGANAATEPETLRWAAVGTTKTFLGLMGDPIARHNLPDQPSFTPAGAGLFLLGLVTSMAVIVVRRDHRVLTILLWWVLLCVPAILSRSSTPHYPRLFGALPAAILIAVLPFGWLASFLRYQRPRWSIPVAGALLTVLLIAEAGHTIRAYFIDWARETDLYTAYQQDLWRFGEMVVESPGAIGIVALNPGYGQQLDYAFADAPILQLDADEENIEGWLDEHLGLAGGKEVLAVAWGEGANETADPKQRLHFYLAREGEVLASKAYRGFDVLTYRLGDNPQFASRGQWTGVDVAFAGGATLLDARWGAANPNHDRGATAAAAGTPLWVILSWRLDEARSDLRAAVDLEDANGHRLASVEDPFVDVRDGPEGLALQAGDVVRTYHMLTTPGTQPPGRLRLVARAYDMETLAPLLLSEAATRSCPGCTGVSVPFGRPILTPPLVSPVVDITRAVNYIFADGITLLGADQWLDSVAPGQVLPLRLYWRMPATSPSLRPYRAFLRGTQADAGTEIPASLQAGSLVHTYADIPVPPHLPSGSYEIVVAADGEEVIIGSVQIAGRTHVYEEPVVQQPYRASFGETVELLGIDEPSTIVARAGETMTVTLVWSVLRTPAIDLARFVHVLRPDGTPLAQRDGAACSGTDQNPSGGACPASSWLPGEVLTDSVVLTLPGDAQPGRYPLGVGWYTAETLERIPARTGTGEPCTQNLCQLPVDINVEP